MNFYCIYLNLSELLLFNPKIIYNTYKIPKNIKKHPKINVTPPPNKYKFKFT